jgi:dCMP deaminase
MSDVTLHTNWDIRFLDLASHVAFWSKDPSTKVGAVIANKDHQVLSLGYNGFPRGVRDLKSRYEDRDTKLLFVAHAERNALDNAFTDVRGATLYSTLCPCNECAKSIIQRGIGRVITMQPPAEKYELFNFNVTFAMFREANVEFVLI